MAVKTLNGAPVKYVDHTMNTEGKMELMGLSGVFEPSRQSSECINKAHQQGNSIQQTRVCGLGLLIAVRPRALKASQGVLLPPGGTVKDSLLAL